jgi:hypothetical protein
MKRLIPVSLPRAPRKYFSHFSNSLASGGARDLLRVRIKDLRATQHSINPERLKAIAEWQRQSGHELPPVRIERWKKYLVIRDGHHRVEAALRNGSETIWATVETIADFGGGSKAASTF